MADLRDQPLFRANPSPANVRQQAGQTSKAGEVCYNRAMFCLAVQRL